MKQIARAALRLVLLAVPCVIAACYGMSARFTKQGRVIDKDSHVGVGDIKVGCIDSTGKEVASAITTTAWVDPASDGGERAPDAGVEVPDTTTGTYTLWHDIECAHLEVTDTKSPARYVAQPNVPYAVETVLLEKVK